MFTTKFKTGYLLFILLLPLVSKAQVNFQKLYFQPDSASFLQCYDAKQTKEGGYVMTGLASAGQSNTYLPFLIKLDCHGNMEWQKYFGNSQSTANINSKVIVTQDSNFVVINNLGIYTNYNGMIAKVSRSGNIIWQKLLNLSTSNDIVSDVIESSDGHLILTGSTKSTPDVSLIKLTANGDLVWHKSFGNAGQYDDGNAVIETYDGGYLIAGRYVSMETFNAVLLKTDSSGTLQWLKCYGDTLQHMVGLDVKELPNHDLIMVGSNTLLKPNFQSFGDNYVMRLNASGDTLWTKIFYGTPDQFENVSSVEIDSNQNLILGVATGSYPVTGFVPNKNAIMRFSPSGNLTLAKTYNSGASHYTRISKNGDGSILMSGFGNTYGGPVGFQALLVKLDHQLNSGCFETDVLNNTVVTTKAFKITQPIPVLNSGANVTANTSTNNLTIVDSTLCESFSPILASFTYQDTCISGPTLFQASTAGVTGFYWDFGDTVNNTSSLSNPIHQFSHSGQYTITLIVSNGCDQDTTIQSLNILDPVGQVYLGPDTTVCIGTPVTLSTQISGYPLQWNTGDTNSSITVTNGGQYILSVNGGGCGLVSDTIQVSVIPCPQEIDVCEMYFPNAFSPNSDQMNDYFYPMISPGSHNLKFIRMEIRNRWGNVVYASTNAAEKWDGRKDGVNLAMDTYYYFCQYQCGQEDKIVKGDIILIR